MDNQGIISAPHGSGNPFAPLLPLMTLIIVVLGAVTLFYFQKTIQQTQELRSQAVADEVATVADNCVTAGCNGELCMDPETAARDGVSACVVRPEFACLAHSVCRIQGNGQCGWTPTTGYVACMSDLGLVVASPDPNASPSPSPSESPSPSPSESPSPSPSASPDASPSPSPSPAPLAGDLNADGVVDSQDNQFLIKSFFKTGTDLAADLDRDGKVDLTDYVLFRRIWNP